MCIRDRSHGASIRQPSIYKRVRCQRAFFPAVGDAVRQPRHPVVSDRHPARYAAAKNQRPVSVSYTHLTGKLGSVLPKKLNLDSSVAVSYTHLDHLSMDSRFFVDNGEYVRTTFNTIINAPMDTVFDKERMFTTLDWFPTT